MTPLDPREPDAREVTRSQAVSGGEPASGPVAPQPASPGAPDGRPAGDNRDGRDTPLEQVPAELAEIRHSIDNIDAALIHLLAERFTHTQRVGRLKARHGLPAADPAREAVQIARLRRLAETARLDPAFAEKFLGFVVDEVIRHHRAIAAEDGAAQPGDTTGRQEAPYQSDQGN